MSKNIKQLNKAQKTNIFKNRSSNTQKKGRTKKQQNTPSKKCHPKLGVHTYSSEAKPQAERNSGIWTTENRNVDETKYTKH